MVVDIITCKITKSKKKIIKTFPKNIDKTNKNLYTVFVIQKFKHLKNKKDR